MLCNPPAGLIWKTEVGQKNKQENDAKGFRVPLNFDSICFSVSEFACRGWAKQ